MDLFQKNPNPMWVYDPETLRFLDVNQAASTLYGWSPEEFLAMTILDICPASETDAVRAQAQQAGVQNASGPWTHRHKDGSEHLVYMTSYDVGSATNPARTVLITDVTKAHHTQRETEEMFRSLCASSPAGIFRARMDGYLLYVNPALALAWQMSAEEMQGFNWMRRVHPEDLHPLIQGWLTANAAGQPYEHVFRILLPSGQIRWIHGRSNVVVADGAPAVAVGTIDDITPQRNAEDALRMSEAELRTLTDHLPVALLYIDASGKCRSANRAYEEWFNIPRAEIHQLDFEAIVLNAAGQHAAEMRHAWALARQGIASTFEKSVIVHGNQRIMETSYTPDTNADGIICGVIILLHDITERRQLEEQFRHAQKMEAIGRLAGSIAHDFNNILSIMNGYARLLQQELESTERLGRMSHEIYRAGERAARLTQQLLAFSRKQISQPRIVRIDDLLRDEETLLHRLLDDSVKMEIWLGAGNACIEIDPHRFSQALFNLVVNARDAMPGGGNITIATSIDHHHAVVTVRDNGCGMTAEVKQRIFEPFFTTKAEGKGTGLGLATTYEIIREAGGTITVESAPGEGSTFALTLPLTGQLLLTEVRSQIETNRNHGTETILLIEDDPNIRFLLAHTLKTHGYTVVQAADGQEGMEVARAMLDKIDAIISDAIMPNMNGQEVIAALREQRPDLKAMLVSGHVYSDSPEASGDLQTSFLYKPLSPDTLVSELRQLLDEGLTTT